MNYSAAVTDFFKNPKWLPNLLLGAVCVLIPVVGPLALIGWHIGAQFGRKEWVNPASYPPLDFNDFGKHLGRGVWPFLVNLVAGIVILPLMWIFMFVPMGILLAAMGPDHGGKAAHSDGALVAAVVGTIVVLAGLLAAVVSVIIKPMMLRAAICQDFGQAFNFRFVKDFFVLTWAEQIVSLLFLFFVAIALMFAGMLVFCVGTYAVAGLLIFVQWHLERQLYDLYLARGGTPAPVSPNLTDSAPPSLR